MRALAAIGFAIGILLSYIGFQFYLAGQVEEQGYFLEVQTKSIHNDGREFIQLFELIPNTGIQGKYLEHDFYCTYWLQEETTTYPEYEVVGAGVDCQPCAQNEGCESQSMTVKEFNGKAQLELSREALWKHRIRFIRLSR